MLITVFGIWFTPHCFSIQSWAKESECHSHADFGVLWCGYMHSNTNKRHASGTKKEYEQSAFAPNYTLSYRGLIDVVWLHIYGNQKAIYLFRKFDASLILRVHKPFVLQL